MKIAYQGKDPVVDYDERAAILRHAMATVFRQTTSVFFKENGAGGVLSQVFDGICQLEIIYNLCFDESIQNGTSHT